MRGWTSSIGGVALVGAAYLAPTLGMSNAMVLPLAAGALVLFYRGYRGFTITQSTHDAMLPMNLYSNPLRTVITLASDRLHKAMKDRAELEATDGGSGIDIDAIIDRYMAERSEKPLPQVDLPPSIPGGFGRKGL